MLSLLLVLAAAPTNVTKLPPLTAMEKKLAAHSLDGKLEGATLLDAALLASGVPEAEIPAEAKRVRAALAPAVARAKVEATEAARGRRLLLALHETLFRHYAMSATELDHVERTGEFNCLSSAILYLVASEGLLTTARGVVTPHHAFVHVVLDGKTVDVETTTANGFDPDRRKFSAASVRQIAGVTQEEFLAGLKQAEELPSLSLVAAVYSNRAVALAQRGDAAAAALALDRGARMATGGLQTRLADWRASLLSKGARELVDQGRFDDAQKLIELGLEVTEGSHRAILQRNLGIIHHHLAIAAMNRGDWTGALDQVEIANGLGFQSDGVAEVKTRCLAQLAALEGSAARCHAEGLTAKSPGAKEAAACLSELANQLLETDSAKSLQYARRALQLAPAEKSAEASIVYALDRQVHAESEAGRCDEVEQLVTEALNHAHVLAPQKWEGRQMAGVCWAQHFKVAFDAKNWPEAAKELNRALVYLPGERVLMQNLALVELNTGIELANDGSCDEARPRLVSAVRRDSALQEKSTKVLANCAVRRAGKSADAHDWMAVLAEVRRGLRDAPKDELLQKNLSIALHNHAADLLNEKRCPELKALKPELVSASVDPKLLAAAQQVCP